MKKIKIILTVFLILFAVTAVYLYKAEKNKNKDKTVFFTAVNQVTDIDGILKEIRMKETLIREVSASRELITTEVALTEEIDMDDTWMNLDIFKKVQSIIFYGEGIYTINLNDIKQEDMLIDTPNKTVTIRAPRPEIKSVNIIESKTLYKAIDTGLLRGGSEIKLSPSQNLAILAKVKSAMEEKMQGKEMMRQAEENTKTALVKIYSDMLTKWGLDYTIMITLK